MNGVRPIVKFENDDDVWDMIDILIAETIAINKETGKSFDIASSIKSQLPFFACSEAIYDKKCIEDLERYYYCKEFGVAPYEGTFAEQPHDWVEKYFIIRSTLIQKEKEAYAKTGNKS